MSRQRYVIIGVATLALITAIVLKHGFQWIWVYAGWDDPFIMDVRELALTSVLSYCIAAIGAFVLLKHKPTVTMANEVVDELAKTTWPTREETGSATVVVIVTVLVCSVYLGAFDAVWLALTNWILGIEAPLQ